MGYSNNKKLIQSLSTIGIDFQLLVVCGNNKRQYRELTRTLETYDGACTVLPYGFVNNVEVMMSAADCIITKPGGLTVSEALAKNLPMILVDPIPGHEERNVEFLMNNGMAMLVTKTFPVDEAVYHLFTNPARLQSVRETMHAIAHPDATSVCANSFWTCRKPFAHKKMPAHLCRHFFSSSHRHLHVQRRARSSGCDHSGKCRSCCP